MSEQSRPARSAPVRDQAGALRAPSAANALLVLQDSRPVLTGPLSVLLLRTHPDVFISCFFH